MSTGLANDDDEKSDLDQAIARSDKLIGEVLASRYQIEMRLGEGAMGSVYKARHVKVGRAFAVKILHKKLLEDKKVAQRFEREAELAGRLRHPNVVGVVDVGETADGLRYMVMDFAKGTDLATMLGEAPMPAARIIGLTRQMLEGLYHAHEAGLIHRDFKPENVIIENDDHGVELPRIVDFGIAILREGGEAASSSGRLTTNGLVLGTPHYMAPEQAVADPIDHRIDLFALGIVIYEMLCGKLPFDGTGAEVARANLLLDPPAIAQRVPYLEVDPLLEAFARLLMSKKRDLRPATAKAAREILDLVEKDRPAAALALGVPLTVVRPPTHTEPSGVAAQAHMPADTVQIATTLAPEVPAFPTTPPGASVAALSAPPFPAAPPRVSRERDITTDSTAPLAPRRRGWIIGGTVALVASAGITIALTRDDDAPAKSNVVTMQPIEGSATVEPGSAVVPDPAPDPTPDPTPPTPPETGSATAPIVDVDSGSGKRDPRKRDPKRDGKRPKQGAEGSAQPPDVVKVVPPDSGSATVAVKPAGPPTASEVYKQYAKVGAELKALQQSKGDDAVTDLWSRYRLIQIQQATASEANRVQAISLLSSISKTAASRR